MKVQLYQIKIHCYILLDDEDKPHENCKTQQRNPTVDTQKDTEKGSKHTTMDIL